MASSPRAAVYGCVTLNPVDTMRQSAPCTCSANIVVRPPHVLGSFAVAAGGTQDGWDVLRWEAQLGLGVGFGEGRFCGAYVRGGWGVS